MAIILNSPTDQPAVQTPAQHRGLTSAEATARLRSVGLNQLPEPAAPHAFTLFVRQFTSPFIYVLMAAAVVSYGLGQTVNAWFILAVLVINAAIGTFQEHSAAQAAAALRKLVPSFASVIRDGRLQRAETSAVVPGDLLQLASGDKVAADARIVELQGLEVDESMLTGESMAVMKQVIDGDSRPDISRVYAGTMVRRGRALAVVEATGARTEIGQIAQHVTGQPAAKPPLLLRIERFTMLVSVAVVLLIALMFGITLLRGDDLASVFLLGVALAVSAIPEGLPAAITVALAIGMRRMAKVGVIIRKLVAVEALGSCTFIATDKTGTLTVNEMTVKQIWLPDDHALTVSGEGIDIHGALEGADDESVATAVEQLVTSAVLASEGGLEQIDGTWVAHGDMVDVAFSVLAHKLGHAPEHILAQAPRVAQIPYESENGYAASLNGLDEHLELHVKGALETILPMCVATAGSATLDQTAIAARASALAAAGYRVLAVAQRPTGAEPAALQGALHGLRLLGLVGIIDPVRAEAAFAVKKAHAAGVEVAMITGDHPQTALAIAREAGIVSGATAVVTGAALEQAEELGSAALDQLILQHRVFARVTPVQKRLVVERLIEHGHYVAVTGDGVNDAPALRCAHVGVAMGYRGTDVARESADLILTDDNFASIVSGLREGRVVYNNIRKVIFLLISTGAAEITLFLWSLSFGLPLPLLPIQLLWLNLVTNGVQDVALAFEPAEGEELDRRPRRPEEPIFDRLMIERVMINAAFMGTIAFSVFYVMHSAGAGDSEARNITLLLMVLFENVHALNSRSERRSLFHMRFLGNPLLIAGIFIAQGIHIASMHSPGISALLDLQPVDMTTWSSLLALAMSLLFVDEIHKWRLRRA